MVQGFYKMIFNSTAELAVGIVVLENGLFQGGCSKYFYTGEYVLKGEILIVQISLIHHTDDGNKRHGQIKLAELRLQGLADKKQMFLKGTVKNGVGEVVLSLTRIADKKSSTFITDVK